MWIGIGIGINRNRYAQGIFNAYSARVTADGGVTEGGACVDAVSGLLLTASLLLIPSGYKSGKAYAQIPTNGNGDLTWTRASDAWRTNADGLIQRVPWNLFTYSEDFSNAAWTKNASSVSTTSVQSPIGPNAFLYSISNLSTNFINQAKAIANTTNTFSIFVKKNVGSLVQLNLGSFNSTFNFDTESISNTSLMSFQRFSNGWYRLILTANPATNTSTFLSIPSSGSVSDSVYIACSQLVEGSSAQTYFPTTDRLNVPRLSYMYGSCPALLLEPQRTNIFPNSQTTANWSFTNMSRTANYGISPDGTQNADLLSPTTSGSVTFQSDITTSSLVIGQPFVVSFFIKLNASFTSDAGTNILDIRLSGPTVWSRPTVRVNLETGEVTSINNAIYISSTNFGNGWFRITFGATPTGTSGQVALQSPTSVTMNGGSFYIWGLQGEANATYATSYIPSQASSATRVADSFSRSNIYTNGLITSSGGTWFVELRNNVAYTRDNVGNHLILSDTSLTNFFRLRNDGTPNTRLRIQKNVSGVGGDLFLTTTNTVKIAIKWNGTSADLFVNGVKEVSATSFTATQLQDLASNPQLPAFIQAMALYPTPLSDTDCTTLTTL